MGSIKTWAADDSNRSKALYLLVIKLLITLYAFVLAYTLLVGFTTRSQFVFRFVALRTFLHSLVWFFYSSRREEQNTDMKIIDNFSYDPWDWSLVWSKRAEEQKLLQVKHLVPAGVEAGGEDTNGKYILAPSAFVGLPKVASSALMGLPTVASSAFTGLPKENRIEDFTTRATPLASMPPVKMDSTAEVTAPQRPATTSVAAVSQRPAAATSTTSAPAKPPKQTGNEEIRLRKKQKKKEKKLKKRERIRLRKLEEGGEESMSSASSTASSSDADTTTLEVNTAEYA